MRPYVRNPLVLLGLLLLAMSGYLGSCVSGNPFAGSLGPGGSIHGAALELAPKDFAITYPSPGGPGIPPTGTAVTEHGGGLASTIGGAVTVATGGSPFGPLAGFLLGILGSGVVGLGVSRQKDTLITTLTQGVEAGADSPTKKAIAELSRRYGVSAMLESYLSAMGPLGAVLGHFVRNALEPAEPPATSPPP
jgi:hypothetical protein